MIENRLLTKGGVGYSLMLKIALTFLASRTQTVQSILSQLGMICGRPISSGERILVVNMVFQRRNCLRWKFSLSTSISKLPYSGIQPYIFYIDARWGSFALMEKIRDARCYGVLSLSSTAKPKALMMWMRTDLGVKDWWSVGYPSLTANLITIHTKKKTFLNILTNWAPLHSETVTYRKRKSLKESIQSSFCCSEGI